MMQGSGPGSASGALQWGLSCGGSINTARASACMFLICDFHVCCRGPGQGAPASFAMSHEALAAADVDWIVVCPCGLDLEQTAKELPALTSQPWW